MRPRTRLLGVDYGTVRVGLAVTDADRIIASPLEIRERQGPEKDAAFFRALVEREQVGGLVVGLPLHTTGREGVKAAEARAFGAWLGGLTGLPVIFADERFSTAFAESALWSAGMVRAFQTKIPLFQSYSPPARYFSATSRLGFSRKPFTR